MKFISTVLGGTNIQ